MRKVNNYTNLKKIKERTKKIGKTSIHNIIKTDKLSFSEKIDFIRHNHTYYEGNYEFFYTSENVENSNKKWLNALIHSVILQQKDPSVLKNFNKRILKWKRSKK